MFNCNEMKCLFSGISAILSDQCTCQIFFNSSMNIFELVWRNVSIFSKVIPIRVAPVLLSVGKQMNDDNLFSVFGSNFDKSCICSFNGMLSYAVFVNVTEMSCIFSQGTSAMLNVSVVCDGLSSEPLHFYPSSKDSSSFFVESFAQTIDGSASCANVVGSALHAIKYAYLCDQAVDLSRNNVTRFLKVCVTGSPRFCRLKLFDHSSTVVYSAMVNSSSMGVLAISPSVFVSESWITITITAINLNGSTCSLSGSQESFVSADDVLVLSHYLNEGQSILVVQCTDVSSMSQTATFSVFPRNFVYSIAPVVHASGSSTLFTLFGRNFDALSQACCRIGEEYAVVQKISANQAFCDMHVPGRLNGNVSISVYHVCGERHFVSFAIQINTRSSVILVRPFLRSFGDVLHFNSALELQCTLKNTTVASIRLNASQHSCFFNISDKLVNQTQIVVVRDLIGEPLSFAIMIIRPMSITPPLSNVAFLGRAISIVGHFPEEIGPFSCVCETSSFETVIGDVVATQSTATKLECFFHMPIQSRCQIGIQDRDGHRAVTTVFLVGNMSFTKIHAESMVVGHLSTVTMAGHNFFDVFKYDCLLGSSTFTAFRISDSLCRSIHSWKLFIDRQS